MPAREDLPDFDLPGGFRTFLFWDPAECVGPGPEEPVRGIAAAENPEDAPAAVIGIEGEK